MNFITFNSLLKSSTNRMFLFAILSIVIFLISINNGMFWDNVLFASKIGNHLYDTNIFNWYIPDSFDSGHPPTLGFLLAILWNIFGHKLWVSHLLMIPFTFGLFYQLFRLAKFYTKPIYFTFFAFILIMADTTLFTQLVIVNPEVIQLFLFFFAINSVLYNQFNLKIIALFFLSIISFRSMMLCFGVFLFEFLNNLLINKQRIKLIFNWKFIASYIIGSIPASFYLIWHYLNKGWMIFDPNSPWNEHHQLNSLYGLIRNIVVLGHRYVDFGRFFIYLFIFYSLFKFKSSIFTKEIKQLFLLAFSSVFIIMITSILMTNPFGHRYFLASYTVLILLSFVILTSFYRGKKIIYIFLFLGLTTGNFWIYPRNIAQGWDATLAHVPYYNLRIDAINYLDKNNIKIEDVGTFFPNSTIIDNVDLSGDYRSFSSFNGENEYLFYSNVYNLSDEEYETIDNNYILIKQFKTFNILINIYKHNS